MDNQTIAALRREYSREELSRASVAADPFVQFANWFDEYLSSQPTEPNAVVLSTVDEAGHPSSRVVLLKGFDARGLVFFTNYGSKKARDLKQNPRAAMTFFWPELERQVHVCGVAEKVSREETETYFATRPVESQIGAWASEQSVVLESRAELMERFKAARERFTGGEIPCPPFWGGFRIVPNRFEFWQGRTSRLHDRISYELSEGIWIIQRLSP